MIRECIQQEDWKYRHAGYIALGYTSEACKHIFCKNLDEVVRLVASGVEDADDRVKNAGLLALGLMITDYNPQIQRKYHSEINQKLLSIIRSDDMDLKLKTTSLNVLINFMSGLFEGDDDDIDGYTNKDVAVQYADDFISVCIDILNQPFIDESWKLEFAYKQSAFQSIAAVA